MKGPNHTKLVGSTRRSFCRPAETGRLCAPRPTWVRAFAGTTTCESLSSQTPAFSIESRLGVGRLKDTPNGCIQQGVKLGIGLLGRQPLDQRPRKARHDAVVPAQAVVAFFPCITARQRNH